MIDENFYFSSALISTFPSVEVKRTQTDSQNRETKGREKRKKERKRNHEQGKSSYEAKKNTSRVPKELFAGQDKPKTFNLRTVPPNRKIFFR